MYYISFTEILTGRLGSVARGFGAAVVVVGAGVVVTVVSMYVVSGRSVVAKAVGSASLFPERSTEISVSVSTALSPELSESDGP